MNVSICRHCMSIWVGSPRSLRSLSMPLGAKALQRLPIRGHVSGPRHVRCANVSWELIKTSLQLLDQKITLWLHICWYHFAVGCDLFFVRSTQQFGSNQTFPVVSWWLFLLLPQWLTWNLSFSEKISPFFLSFSEVLTRVPFLMDMSEPKTFVTRCENLYVYIYIFLFSYLFSFHHFISRFFKILCLMFWSWERIGITRIWLVWVAPAQFKAALGYDNWICAQDG